MVNDTAILQESRPIGGLYEYISIARLDHATKHVFIIPGVILAYALREPALAGAAPKILVGFLSAISAASANYVLNEWLDRHFDAFHPIKSGRTAVHWHLVPALVYAEYALLAVISLWLATQVGTSFFLTEIAFLLSGVIYNVRPLRTKDRGFVDVISESVNNPIRLILGWTMLDPSTLPPASLLLAYWAGGGFLMSAKRLSEYRDIVATSGASILCRYRRSFLAYTLESLTVSCFLYGIISAFFLAVFLIRYRLEYMIAFPFIGGLFGCYLWLSLLRNSIAQRPERMFRSKRLMFALSVTIVVMLAVSFINVPILADLTEPGFIPVHHAS